jgi:hypothetical protein
MPTSKKVRWNRRPGTYLFIRATTMSGTISVKEDSAGLRCICRGHHDIASRLRLEQAIKQANQLSGDEQLATGEDAIVECMS